MRHIHTDTARITSPSPATLTRMAEDALLQSDAFADTTREFRSRALLIARSHRWTCDEIIFPQGEPATHYFLVISGWVRLVRINSGGTMSYLSIVGPGSSLAAVAVLKNSTYLIEASAVSVTWGLSWNHSDGQSLCKREPKFLENLLKLVSNRFSDEQERAGTIMSCTVEARTARVLRKLDVQSGGGPLPPLLRADLAGLASTTVPTVSRILSQWKRGGIVRLGRRKVEIVNHQVLSQIASDNYSRGTIN